MSTLTSYTTAYLSGRRKRGEITAATARNMRYCLDSLDGSFGNRPLSQYTRRAIDAWLETIGHLAPSTRRNHLGTCRSFSAWMLEHDHIAKDPTEKIPAIPQPRSVPRAMANSDVGRLYDVAPDRRAKAIISLMVGCGLRCVEVSRLQIADYDRDAAWLTVTGKGSHQRMVPVPDEVAGPLNAYLMETGVVSGHLIRSSRIRGRGLSAGTISTYMSRWMWEAGVKARQWDGVSAHALRHTAASDVLDNCHDLRTVQAMLGHEHLSSTAIYLRRAALDQMREAMEGRHYHGDDDHDPPMQAAA